MRFGLPTVVCLCLAFAQTVSAEIKTMTVDVNKLYDEYHVTKKERADLGKELETYNKERIDRQKSIVELNKKIKVP